MNLAKIKPQNNLYHLRKFPRGIVLSLVILTGVFLGRAQSVANADFPVKTNTSVFTWSNPLPFQYREARTEEQTELRDPCIIRDGDTCYLVFTMWPFRGRDPKHLDDPGNGSSPGIAMYSTKNFKNWKFENWLVKSSELPENFPLQAPLLGARNSQIRRQVLPDFLRRQLAEKRIQSGRQMEFGALRVCRGGGQGTGPYQHITWIKGAGCDATLFQDTDGKTYAIIPRYNIDVQQIDLSGIAQDEVKLIGKPQTLVYAKTMTLE